MRAVKIAWKYVLCAMSNAVIAIQLNSVQIVVFAKTVPEVSGVKTAIIVAIATSFA